MIQLEGEILHNILIEFGIHMKLVQLINVLTEACSGVRVGRRLSDGFFIRNYLEQEDALSPLLCDFAFKCAIRRVQSCQEGLKVNGTYQLLVCMDDVIYLVNYFIQIIKSTVST
jgi:hypothetical protein